MFSSESNKPNGVRNCCYSIKIFGSARLVNHDKTFSTFLRPYVINVLTHNWIFQNPQVLCFFNLILNTAQGDQKVSVHLTITVHTTDELKMAITEYIRNVDRAILNRVFENTVRRVNKCLETGGGGHFEHYL